MKIERAFREDRGPLHAHADYPRIDVHTHAFHPKIAPKVLLQLENHYGITPVGTGQMDDLLFRLDRAGLNRCALLCAATAPAQVVPALQFVRAMAREYPQVIPFGTMHPEDEDWEAHLESMRAWGFRGIKLHPDFQGFRLDDPRLIPMIEAAWEDFVFMIHVGDNLPPDENPSCPFKVAALAERFPDARFVAAHMGGYKHWEHVIGALGGTGVYVDTSSTLPFIDDDLFTELMAVYPEDRILFGSDYPLFDPGQDMRILAYTRGLGIEGVERLLANTARLFPGV